MQGPGGVFLFWMAIYITIVLYNELIIMILDEGFGVSQCFLGSFLDWFVSGSCATILCYRKPSWTPVQL